MTPAQERALRKAKESPVNTVRASHKISAAAIAACGRLGLLVVTRDREGVIGTLTRAGAEAIDTSSLADRARAKGFEPETEEGGRAMMQSLTFADIAKLDARKRRPRLELDTPVMVEIRYVGGSRHAAGAVKWDYGNDVDVRLTVSKRIVRAQRTPSGALYVYG